MTAAYSKKTYTAGKFFDDLFETLTGREGTRNAHESHGHCRQCGGCVYSFKCSACGKVPGYDADTCPYCTLPVTIAQIDDSEAFMIDERGPDDGRYAHRSCAQAAKEP